MNGEVKPARKTTPPAELRPADRRVCLVPRRDRTQRDVARGNARAGSDEGRGDGIVSGAVARVEDGWESGGHSQ